MKRCFLFIIISVSIFNLCLAQKNDDTGVRIMFHGIVLDANTFNAISNSQILINHNFTSVSGTDGTFAFFVNINDTVLFKHLGYKPTTLFVSDTLVGKDFNAGIYMKSDTVSIGEVIIVPRFVNLKSVIMNTPSRIPSTMDNARYNVAISAYQGRTTQGKLGDPAMNYGHIREQQKTNAYEKGQISSDQISGISPLLLLPAAYLLIHGPPARPASFENKLTPQELEQIKNKYLEMQEKKER
jgi:hypothetical protein